AAGPVSRILCAARSPRHLAVAKPAKTKSGTTVIPLGRALLHGSSDLPGSYDAPSRCVAAETDSSPIWSCSAWGFPCHRHYWQRGALLPHLFTLTSPKRGGIFSVA